MSITKEIVEEVARGWDHLIAVEATDVAVFLECNETLQDVGQAFKHRDYWHREESLRWVEARGSFLERTLGRKYLDGLIGQLGWRFTMMTGDNGVWARPGLAYIIWQRGSLPTRKTVMRVTQQGNATVPTFTVFDPKSKSVYKTKVIIN